MADKKAVTLEQLEIAKNYIDNKDAENIKSVEFVDNTIKFYTSEDKSGEAVAEIVLPEETFLDGSKTELVSDFAWDITKYPKSTDPELNGKSVLVLAVKSVRTVRYSFISLDSVIAKLIGEDTESVSVSVAEDVISFNVKVSELSGNRIIIKDDGLYVGTVDNTPSWAVSTNDEVREMFTVSGGGITLASMSIGDTVKIMENGEPVDYLIVHKGLPSDMYDESCDGVWLLRKYAVPSHLEWDNKPSDYSSINYYKDSKIYRYLNNSYINYYDENIRGNIKTVNLPNEGTNSQGIPCKLFLLSTGEVGCTEEEESSFHIEGSKLAYFSRGNSIEETKRLRIIDDTTKWWLRTMYSKYYNTVYIVQTDGRCVTELAYKYSGLYPRPAFILPYEVTVDSDGVVMG